MQITYACSLIDLLDALLLPDKLWNVTDCGHSRTLTDWLACDDAYLRVSRTNKTCVWRGCEGVWGRVDGWLQIHLVDVDKYHRLHPSPTFSIILKFVLIGRLMFVFFPSTPLISINQTNDVFSIRRRYSFDIYGTMLIYSNSAESLVLGQILCFICSCERQKSPFIFKGFQTDRFAHTMPIKLW